MLGGKMRFKIICLLALLLCSGCATVKEGVKCVAGVSTKVLEDGRKDAVRKTFSVDYTTCDAKVRQKLKKTGAYIYAEDKTQKLIAVYTTESDTTPVGIFFVEIDPVTTEIEVSSPSTEAKEIMAKRLFNAMEGKDEAGKEEKGSEDAKGLLGDK
jgi:hypothetical protein